METIVWIGGLFVVAVIAYALGRGRRMSFDEFIKLGRSMTPQLNIGVPIAFMDVRFKGQLRETYRREFVPTHITSGPSGTFVELQDRESYERRSQLPPDFWTKHFGGGER